MSYDANRLKETQLQILDYIAEVCEANHIEYFLFFGTLLGAIRHKGYIPWDDDLDIACPRSEYDKLVRILEENMASNNRFFVQSLHTDPFSPVLHTKVRMNGTCCIEKNTVSEKQHVGIFVDIFPLDYYLDTPVVRLRAHMIRLLYSLRGNAVFPPRKSLKRVLMFPLSHFPIQTYNRWINKLFQKMKSKQTDFLTCYLSRYPAKNTVIRKEWISRTQAWNFENRQYYVPFDYDSVLQSVYGKNYMELPPEDKRFSHTYQSVSWDDAVL